MLEIVIIVIQAMVSTVPIYTVSTCIACALVAGLIMYASARANAPPCYETRRSIVLLEAARQEASTFQLRDTARTPACKAVVCVSHPWECRWWSDRLGVSPAALRAVVRQVGPMAADIERHLRMRGH
jgi:hypothetical protein